MSPTEKPVLKNSVAEKECAHRPCNCAVAVGSDYCSPQCERARDETDCSCGHPDCRAKA